MELVRVLRTASGRMIGAKGRWYIHRFLREKIRHFDVYESAVAGRRCLEVGGLSEIFTDIGFMPIYPKIQSLDNCCYSAQTIWTQRKAGQNPFPEWAMPADSRNIVSDATALAAFEDGAYDCVLASHCLEHVANPLRALGEWKRVLKPGGTLLMVLPHKEGTFDWRRPTTRIEHLLTDYQNQVGEDDLTHVPEVLEYHDLTRDPAAGTLEQFRQRCLENFRYRAMHHHVFDTHSAVALIDRAGFEVIQVGTVKPCHIVVLARKCEAVPDNSSFLSDDATYRLESCFAIDRAVQPSR